MKKKSKTQQETLILSNPLNFYLKNWKCLKKKKHKNTSPLSGWVLLPISSWAETGVWESLSPAPGSSAALAESLWEELSSLPLLFSRLGWVEVVVALVLLLSHVLLESSRKIKYLIFTLEKITTKSDVRKALNGCRTSSRCWPVESKADHGGMWCPLCKRKLESNAPYKSYKSFPSTDKQALSSSSTSR